MSPCQRAGRLRAMQNPPYTPPYSKSFIQLTPESRLGRSDSKNPSSTCRGLTTAGRPCRRAIAVSKDLSLASPLQFCWQHQDQYVIPAPDHFKPLRERSSIDSMVSKLGFLNLAPIKASESASSHGSSPNSHEPIRLQYPDLSPNKARVRLPTRPRRQWPVIWSSLCCMATIQEKDEVPPLYQAPQPSNPSMIMKSQASPARAQVPKVRPVRRGPSLNCSASAPSPPSRSSPASWLPPDLSASTRAALLAELARPISAHDDEGYIYIFWLTDSPATPPSAAASDLLPPAPSTPRYPADQLLRTYSTRRNTVMLKIGRASNVHRRMNEWTRQCGYALSLLRWYPYVTSETIATRREALIQKVKHAHRVERLIHIELGDCRVKRRCDACGAEHREWFEVEGSARGVGRVDKVVRRWVEWANADR